MFGRRVEELRRFRALTRDELAERAGVAARQIANYELYGSWPSPETLVNLSRALHVDVVDLFDFSYTRSLLSESSATTTSTESDIANRPLENMMIECKELTGKVIQHCTIYQDGPYGPEVRLHFEDGTEFSATLTVTSRVDAEYTRDEGGEPRVLRSYDAS